MAVAAPTRCACSHRVDEHHPAGRCAATLPPFLEEELPAWACPCRHVVASGVTSLLLRSVQSCTVGAAAHVPDQRKRATAPAMLPAAGPVERVWRVMRTRA